MVHDSRIAIDARADIRAECVRLDRAWELFVRSGRTRDDIRPVIRQSWTRCVGGGLDALNHRTRLALSESEVLDYRENDPLFSLVEPILGGLVGSALDSDHMLVLTDPCGNIVSIEGDHSLQKRAELMNFVVGSSWDEIDAGTNAIGTAIAAAMPVQVFASEHYCEQVHPWTCSASPILDPCTNRVLGVIDLTGLREVFHPHTLAVVLTATRLIEQQLKNQLEVDRFHLLERYIRETSRTPDVPIAVMDRSLRVVRASQELHEHGWIDGAGRLSGCPIETVSIGARQNWEAFESSADALWVFECSVCLDRGRPAGLIVRAVKNGSYRTASRLEQTRRSELTRLFSGKDRLHAFDALLGEANSFKKALAAAKGAGSDLPVLIDGETGTGKELIAQAIHSASARNTGPFVVVNCAALPDPVSAVEFFQVQLESSLGARHRIESEVQIDVGTLFLDNVGDLDTELQAVLLRVLEKQEALDADAQSPRTIAARLIAATDRELLTAVERGSFRRDLYYRLNVIKVSVPPLRNRMQDFEALLEYFCRRACSGSQRALPHFDRQTIQVLKCYHWPGNVRELRNFAERVVATGFKTVFLEHLPSEFLKLRYVENAGPRGTNELYDEDFALIRSALDQTGGNVAQAARLLGRSRSTIYRYLHQKS